MLAGRIADPIVGRDVLIGMLAGMVTRVMGQGINDFVSSQPHLLPADALFGIRATLGILSNRCRTRFEIHSSFSS